jgi:hypothetical protein
MNYINEDLTNPQYIFHGSPKLIKGKVEPRQAVCTSGIEQNTKEAMYGAVTFEGAVCFAIPKKPIEEKHNNSWTWEASYNEAKAILYNMTIDKGAYGYVYVFDVKNFVKAGKDIQYTSYISLTPLDVIKVYYKDYKYLFEFRNGKDENMTLNSQFSL